MLGEVQRWLVIVIRPVHTKWNEVPAGIAYCTRALPQNDSLVSSKAVRYPSCRVAAMHCRKQKHQLGVNSSPLY